MAAPEQTRAPDPSTGPDATSQILERLRTHGAQSSRYEARGEVARGGMGLVLRVWDQDLRRELAMKVVLGADGKATAGIPPKVMGRFLEEAQVTGQLDHPGIVPVHELGIDEDGAVFFTMRLVRGRDLKEVFELVRAGDAEWTLTRALWAMLKVCEAMAYAHTKGVIHRDLKPANVMVGRFGEVYVMDWGLARVLGQPDRHDVRLRREDTSLSIVQSERRADASHSADSVLFTMDGDVVGTPAYMAPEQARGEIERLGPLSDVYSVGAMLYHLLTGEMPFVAPGAKVSQHMVLRWALEGPPRSVRTIDARVPEELIAITEKAMAREPGQRYADMAALADDLRAYLENRVVRAYRTGAWIEFQKWVQRNRRLAVAWGAAGAVALLGLATTLVVQVRGRRAAEDARALAVASEQRAAASLAEAQRQEAIARRERSNVLRLSAFRELEDLALAAERLWPAVPERSADMEAWMTRAEALIAGLDPSADGQDPGHRAQLAELRARRREVPAEERARVLVEHPRAAEFQRLERRVASLRAAADVRAGRATPPDAALDPALAEYGATDLNERAFPLVDPARTEFGREAEGFALASAALERATPAESAFAADTLAWAAFALGLDEEALEASRAALADAPVEEREQFAEYLTRLARAVQAASSPAAAAELRGAEEELAALTSELFGPAFENQDDGWWHDELAELVRSIEAFAHPERGLVHGVAAPHGWGVARRLAFARALEERSVGEPAAQEAWALARATLRDPGRAPAYGGLELAPQLGLLPLGVDPDSGLYEFADLATGEPPQRGADGRLVLTGASSVVFVLLPGGETTIGAQAYDPGAENFDPEARPDEGPVHTVTLAPFFFAKHELTQGQWLRFTGANPSKHLAGTQVAGRALDERSPVEQVSWLTATKQLARLGWRLPTEAQWEYAARAGVPAPWWTGEDGGSLAGTCNLADRFARTHGAPWPTEPDFDDGHLVHAPAGSFAANPFGLHDVVGNVYEWCRDHHGAYELEVEGPDAERRGGTSATHVVRGGSFTAVAVRARSARRDSGQPELESEAIGLRPARAISP